MKYFGVITLSVLIAILSQVNAQTSSIRLGAAFSNIKLQQNTSSVTNERRMGILVGYIHNDSILSSLIFRTGAIITSRGENFEFKDGNAEYKRYEQNYYLNVPMTLKFTFPTSLKVKPFLIAGLYVGLGIGGNWESDYYENGELITHSEGDVLYRPIVDDDDFRTNLMYKAMLDLGYNIGFGVDLNQWGFEIGISNGLKNVSPNYVGELFDDFAKQYNMSFSGSLIYTFVKSDTDKQSKRGRKGN